MARTGKRGTKFEQVRLARFEVRVLARRVDGELKVEVRNGESVVVARKFSDGALWAQRYGKGSRYEEEVVYPAAVRAIAGGWRRRLHSDVTELESVAWSEDVSERGFDDAWRRAWDGLWGIFKTFGEIEAQLELLPAEDGGAAAR